MKYTAKIIPEGINTTTANPLKELAALLLGTLAIIGTLLLGLVFISDSLVKFIPVELEQKLFNLPLAETLNADLGDDKHDAFNEINNYLTKVVKALQQGQPDSSPPYRFKLHLIESSEANAFAYPGGNIGVTTELLKQVKSENALAMVLGHEMGHHYARDPLKGAGRGIVLGLLLVSLSGTGTDDWVQRFFGNLSTVGLMSFSRDQEREADKMGKTLLVQHYGHARDADSFFKKMAETQTAQQEVPLFLRSHPLHEERIATLAAPNALNQPLTPIPPEVIDALKSIRPDAD